MLSEITAFNEVTVDGVKYDLTAKREEIIQEECGRYKHINIPYDGITLVSGATAIRNYLKNLSFEIIGNNIKLGEVVFSSGELVKREYLFDNKMIKGTITEIKEKVTKLIEECDPTLEYDGIWICSKLFNGNINCKKLLCIKTSFINSEMDKICQLK